MVSAAPTRHSFVAVEEGGWGGNGTDWRFLGTRICPGDQTPSGLDNMCTHWKGTNRLFGLDMRQSEEEGIGKGETSEETVLLYIIRMVYRPKAKMKCASKAVPDPWGLGLTASVSTSNQLLGVYHVPCLVLRQTHSARLYHGVAKYGELIDGFITLRCLQIIDRFVPCRGLSH